MERKKKKNCPQQFYWSNQVHMKRHNMVTSHRIPEQTQGLFRKMLIASVYFCKAGKNQRLERVEVQAFFEQKYFDVEEKPLTGSY